MNWKLTVALVLAALVVAIVAYVNPFKEELRFQARSPWFYQVDMDDIIHIDVKNNERHVAFNKLNPSTWVFEDPEGVPTDQYRWGGIVLLLSGPMTQRDFSTVRETIDDPAEYGLDQPELIVDVGLTADRTLQFRLGDTTTDGSWHYGQVVGFPQLFLIADGWGDVLARLATDPPIPKYFDKRDPADIVEFNVRLGDPNSSSTAVLRLQQIQGAWQARSFLDDDANRLVDADKWSELVHLVAGPPEIEVEEPFVDDRDYTPWGISEDSRAIEVRFYGITDQGTRFIDGNLFVIGDKTPDGDQYYAVPTSEQFRPPVLRVGAEWADTVFGLFETIPYADTGAAAEGATAPPS
jgi:hypothetical protein